MLTPLRAQLIDELGLQPDEVVGLPMLFAPDPDEPNCGAVALTPNPVNMVVIDSPAGSSSWVALLPDPWFRDLDAGLQHDPLARALVLAFQGRVQVRFLDTWDAYHRWGGEVHCAVGLRRGLAPASRSQPRAPGSGADWSTPGAR
jgi:hypothetical protein